MSTPRGVEFHEHILAGILHDLVELFSNEDGNRFSVIFRRFFRLELWRLFATFNLIKESLQTREVAVPEEEFLAVALAENDGLTRLHTEEFKETTVGVMLGIDGVEEVLALFRFGGIFQSIRDSFEVGSIMNGEEERRIQFAHHLLVILPGHHKRNALPADEGGDIVLVHLAIVHSFPFVKSLENDNPFNFGILRDGSIGYVSKRIIHILCNGLQGRGVLDESDDNGITLLFKGLNLFGSL
mmetsp:Transcript_458/g.805  ORF Transcript_458/g.805 Transcript_458/m.805 type:complete len:241 (-) Transcript_458:405-1127(-)